MKKLFLLVLVLLLSGCISSKKISKTAKPSLEYEIYFHLYYKDSINYEF